MGYNQRLAAKSLSAERPGALLGLKPSRFIHLITVFERHAVLNFSSTRLRRAKLYAQKCFSVTLPPCLYEQVFYWAYCTW
jgi:hypothetical protein